jgi:GNAT superfamily N-acetyltransferase
MKNLIIRPATVGDAEAIRDIFIESYGHDYPYSQMFDVQWLRRALGDDNVVFLVAELDGRMVGTGSVFFEAGLYCDMVGEFGRLVVTPDMRHLGIGTQLMDERLRLTRKRLHFGYVQARTSHPYAQRICQKEGFRAVGFLPAKSQFARRESVAVMAQLFGPARELRRPNPRVLEEIAPLAGHALSSLDLPDDLQVLHRDEVHCERKTYSLEVWTELRAPDLIRLARQCNRPRRVFSNTPINYRIFRLQGEEATYLLAKNGEDLVGALGFYYESTSRTLKIIELLGREEGTICFLISALNAMVGDRLDVAYAEIIISAYNPRLQKILLEQGFFPVAYYPSFVMRSVQRLDAVRLARLYVPFEEQFVLIPEVTRVYEIVRAGMETAAARTS